jgi:hypothetical protein
MVLLPKFSIGIYSNIVFGFRKKATAVVGPEIDRYIAIDVSTQNVLKFISKNYRVLIDNAHLMYNAHPKLFQSIFV